MLELIAKYSAVFFLHAALGCGLILIGSIFVFKVLHKLGWMRRGNNGPLWIASLLRVISVTALILGGLATGIQSGGIEALAQMLEHSSKKFALESTLKLAKPLGITHAEQSMSLAQINQLATQLAPKLVALGKEKWANQQWFFYLDQKWQQTPPLLKSWLNEQLPETKLTPKNLVDQAWRLGAAQTLQAARIQALVFAYGASAAIIILALILECLWLARTRRTPISDR